jgi:4-hydroxyproline epimerase
MQVLSYVDSHTGGEPTRVVLSGFPDLGGGPMAARLEILQREHDAFRRATVGEPRSSEVVVGALLQRPSRADCVAGVIFFNNAGTLGMCGHGTIGLVATLAFLGRIGPGDHLIETSVGVVSATLAADGGVSVENVPAYRHAVDVTLEVPDLGCVVGDVAWGGNWFFLLKRYAGVISATHVRELTATATAIFQALRQQGVRGAGGAVIDHIELFTDSPTPGCDSRNFVLCPGGEYDRSPCGTGTSAKLACLAADGELAPGDIWRQESVIGSVFEASYQRDPRRSDTIIPTIRGRAHMCGRGELLLDASDPFCWGIPKQSSPRQGPVPSPLAY